MGDGDEYGENGCAVLFDCLPEEGWSLRHVLLQLQTGLCHLCERSFRGKIQHLCYIIGRLDSSCPGEDFRELCRPTFLFEK